MTVQMFGLFIANQDDSDPRWTHVYNRVSAFALKIIKTLQDNDCHFRVTAEFEIDDTTGDVQHHGAKITAYSPNAKVKLVDNRPTVDDTLALNIEISVNYVEEISLKLGEYAITMLHDAQALQMTLENSIQWLQMKLMPSRTMLAEIADDVEAQRMACQRNIEFYDQMYRQLLDEQSSINKTRIGKNYDDSQEIYYNGVLLMQPAIDNAISQTNYYKDRLISLSVKLEKYDFPLHHTPKNYYRAVVNLPKSFVQKHKYFIEHAVEMLAQIGKLSAREINVVQTKLFNKTASASTKFIHYKHLFENDPIVKELLELAIEAKYIDPKNIPVVPSKRRLAEIKKTLLEFKRQNDTTQKTIYEQVNNLKTERDRPVVTQLVRDKKTGKIRKRGTMQFVTSFDDGENFDQKIDTQQLKDLAIDCLVTMNMCRDSIVHPKPGTPEWEDPHNERYSLKNIVKSNDEKPKATTTAPTKFSWGNWGE
jgi:hypothetical protein